MSKVVKFNAKAVLGKDFEIMDSFKNVQKANKGIRSLFDAVDAYEKKQQKAHKPVTMMDYQEVISNKVIENTATLLGLGKEEATKLEDMSYSDIFKFYSDVVDKFLDMDVPSVSTIKQVIQGEAPVETKDPKSKEDK